MENLCQVIQEKLFDIPSHPRSILGDLEVCIGGKDFIASESTSVAEISLSKEIIVAVGQWLGNEERVHALVSACADASSGAIGEQLSEQLIRDGMFTPCINLLLTQGKNIIILHLTISNTLSPLPQESATSSLSLTGYDPLLG